MINEKIANVQNLLKSQRIETLILGNFDHQVRDDLMYYILLQHLEHGILCIPQEGKSTLYVTPFEVAQLAELYPNIDILPLQKPFLETLKAHKFPFGYRHTSLPAKQYIFATSPRSKQSDIILLTGEDKLMGIKLPEEQRRLRKAAKIVDSVYSDIISSWSTFETEQDVARAIHIACIEKNVEPSFPPIIASGKNAANPHHIPKNTPLQKGFCVIDMGVRYVGYCSDMTRTLYIGKPTKEECRAYETILDAQSKAIQEIKIGAIISDIAKNCRKNLGKKFEQYFTHSLGHGLGTQVHEWPRVSKKEERALEEGMCITIEPGVYIPDAWGIRIEDDVLVTKDSYDVLTTSPKKLLLV